MIIKSSIVIVLILGSRDCIRPFSWALLIGEDRFLEKRKSAHDRAFDKIITFKIHLIRFFRQQLAYNQYRQYDNQYSD